MGWHSDSLTRDEVEAILEGRGVFHIVPGQPMSRREGEPRILAFAGADGRHLELLVPGRCLWGGYVVYSDVIVANTYEVFRFSIGLETLGLGKAPVVKVSEDSIGRIYVSLPTHEDAKPFIHIIEEG